jgi:VanZ family protein
MLTLADNWRNRVRRSLAPHRISLTAPVLTMVLAATSIPIELRVPVSGHVSFRAFAPDAILNIVGYLPLGVVLASQSAARVAIAAAAIAGLAETSQLFMMHRESSVVDVVCNVLGATFGALLVPRRRRTPFRLTLDARVASVAAVMVATLIPLVWFRAPIPQNDRGWTTAGTLEARWTFDEGAGRVAVDTSGHGVDGTFNKEPKRVPGVRGNAVSLDGATDYIDVGRATPLRLVGSMTVAGWIKATSFPADDAAIVSSHNGIGYQIDTTVDRGPRTVGFKLGNACGNLMARYGMTPLVVGRWYHVAGVYDAPAKSLDVYVNGRLDNGYLLGTVTTTQRSSREAVYIGRRSSDRGFEFAGEIDDVRIYSRALTRVEIDSDMRGVPVATPLSIETVDRDHRDTGQPACSAQSDREDSQLPGAAGVLGALVAVIYFGFWPSARWLPCLVLGAVAGLILLPAAAPSLPVLGRLLIPSTSLAGAVSVVTSLSNPKSETL